METGMEGLNQPDSGTSFVTGLAQSLNSYLGQNIKQQRDIQTHQAEHDIDNPPAQGAGSQVMYMTPDMGEKALPGYGGKMVTDYNQRNPNAPLTIDQASDFLTKAKQMINPDTSKEDDKENARQDKLEQQARQMQTTVRGDQSLMRTETQRDAAGTAYDTLANVASQNRPLSELEYTDLIGQMWKARTGASPTQEELKQLKARTGNGDINKVYQYFTGNPARVGATTQDVVNNLKDFIVQTGSKVDEQHEGYWSTRMKKPTGLDSNRWNNIVSETRGNTFAQQKALSDKKYSSVDIEAKKQALRRKLGI